MAKPEDNPQLEQRVDALEQQVDAHAQAISDLGGRVEDNEAAIADLDARVLALENTVTTPTPPTPEPPGGIIDNTLPEPEEPEPEPGDGGLAVLIATDGTETWYAQGMSENLGDYVDPDGAFVQRCYRAPRQDDVFPGLTVWFRPDADGGRREVVVELGVPLVASLTPANLGAYTAEIWDDDTLVATVEVPSHPWYARWRWQSAPRPVRVSPRHVLAAHSRHATTRPSSSRTRRSRHRCPGSSRGSRSRSASSFSQASR